MTTLNAHNLKVSITLQIRGTIQIRNIYFIACSFVCEGGRRKHSAFVKRSLDTRGKNTEAYNNSCVFLYWEGAWMSSAKWNSCCLFGSGLDTSKVDWVWGFFVCLIIPGFYIKMLITCLTLSFLPYPVVCWKSSRFWLKRGLQTPNCQVADVI